MTFWKSIPKKLYICNVKHTYMKKTTLIILFTIMTLSGFAQGDWCGFERYRADNERIIASGEYPEVVFMGNSITEYWALYHPEFFKQHNYCGRGIGGQTSTQMLARFTADVVNLHPKAVVIMAGTNDVAHNAYWVEHDTYYIMEKIVKEKLKGYDRHLPGRHHRRRNCLSLTP